MKYAQLFNQSVGLKKGINWRSAAKISKFEFLTSDRIEWKLKPQAISAFAIQGFCG